MDDHNSLPANECCKNLNKHWNCSNCIIVLTLDSYQRGRTVCIFCFNKHVLAYYKNKFCFNSSPKSDVSTRKDFSSI